MANRVHLEVLEQGVSAWNQWRSENPNIRPDLSGADCSGRDLCEIDLGPIEREDWDISTEMPFIGANLERTDFSECDLRRAKLNHAELGNANLRSADLTGANLAFAKLSSTLLAEARLENVDLIRAVLFYAWAKSATFRGASLFEAQAMGIMADKANFTNADLTGALLIGGDFERADFSGAKLRRALLEGSKGDDCNFTDADLDQASAPRARFARAKFVSTNLSGASFDEADLRESIFESVNLSRAAMGLSGANLSNARLADIDLRGVDLRFATLVGTNLQGTRLDGCRIYGVSAWDTVGVPASQTGLVISPYGELLTTDDLEVAQFLNLLVSNRRIGKLMNTVTSKTVLLLGRFSPERKAVLDALREELRKHDYIAVMFDFDKAASKDYTETILVLAGLCRFIIADITSPKSSPLELQNVVPNYMTPLIPIIQEGEAPFSMFADLHNKYPDWVFRPLLYRDIDNLLGALKQGIIQRAVERHGELTRKKQQTLTTEHADEFQDRLEH